MFDTETVRELREVACDRRRVLQAIGAAGSSPDSAAV